MVWLGNEDDGIVDDYEEEEFVDCCGECCGMWIVVCWCYVLLNGFDELECGEEVV